MSMQKAGVWYLIGPVCPSHSPQIILTLVPSFSKTGIWSLVYYWYWGSCILSLALRLSQSWNPTESCSVDPGISACTMPLPAVIHWMSPGPMVPLCPLKSSWWTTPSCMYVTVSKPRCGWSGNPAGSLTLKWSSIKKGSSRLRYSFPITLITFAPTPSLCQLGLNTKDIFLLQKSVLSFGTYRQFSDYKQQYQLYYMEKNGNFPNSQIIYFVKIFFSWQFQKILNQLYLDAFILMIGKWVNNLVYQQNWNKIGKPQSCFFNIFDFLEFNFARDVDLVSLSQLKPLSNVFVSENGVFSGLKLPIGPNIFRFSTFSKLDSSIVQNLECGVLKVCSLGGLKFFLQCVSWVFIFSQIAQFALVISSNLCFRILKRVFSWLYLLASRKFHGLTNLATNYIHRWQEVGQIFLTTIEKSIAIDSFRRLSYFSAQIAE